MDEGKKQKLVERYCFKTFDDSQWVENFRMSRGVFLIVCQQLKPHLQRSSAVREALTTEHRVAVAI